MNLDMAHIISNVYTNNIVAILDYQTVFTAFICCYLILVSSCPEINESYNGTYYMPLFLLALNLIVAICVSFISLSPYDEEIGIAT